MKVNKTYNNNMIKINGKTYSGNNIQISNSKVIIDGKDVTNDHDTKEITITVEGNIENLTVDHAKTVEVHGNVGSVKSGSADVTCGNVNGNVQTGSGDVECSHIVGNVQTGSGDVKSNTITGSVKTSSGDIKYKK